MCSSQKIAAATNHNWLHPLRRGTLIISRALRMGVVLGEDRSRKTIQMKCSKGMKINQKKKGGKNKSKKGKDLVVSAEANSGREKPLLEVHNPIFQVLLRGFLSVIESRFTFILAPRLNVGQAFHCSSFFMWQPEPLPRSWNENLFLWISLNKDLIFRVT